MRVGCLLPNDVRAHAGSVQRAGCLALLVDSMKHRLTLGDSHFIMPSPELCKLVPVDKVVHLVDKWLLSSGAAALLIRPAQAIFPALHFRNLPFAKQGTGYPQWSGLGCRGCQVLYICCPSAGRGCKSCAHDELLPRASWDPAAQWDAAALFALAASTPGCLPCHPTGAHHFLVCAACPAVIACALLPSLHQKPWQ